MKNQSLVWDIFLKFYFKEKEFSGTNEGKILHNGFRRTEKGVWGMVNTENNTFSLT